MRSLLKSDVESGSASPSVVSNVFVMTYMPIDGKPFAVSMGLRAMDPSQWIEIDDHYDFEIQRKHDLMKTQHAQVFGALEEGLAGSQEAARMLVEFLPRRFPEKFSEDLSLDSTLHPLEAAALLVQEDLVIMSPGKGDQVGQWILTAASVCFPSRWNLQRIIGLNMHGIHDPVPDYERRIGQATDTMFSKFTPDRPVWRINWTVLDDDELFQPTGDTRYIKKFQDRTGDFGDRMYLRAERQTLTALPETGDVLFTIRTYVESLNGTATRHPEFRTHLGQTLATTSAETRYYKGWEPVWDDLMAWTQGH